MSDSVVSIFEISVFLSSTNIFIFVDHFVYHFKIEIFLFLITNISDLTIRHFIFHSLIALISNNH